MFKRCVLCFGMAALIASCGGSDGGGDTTNPPSNITSSATMGTLSTAQLGELCDWAASYYGGYDKTVVCSQSASASSKASQADCVQRLQEEIAGCASFKNATYAQLLNCYEVVLSNVCAHNDAIPACDFESTCPN